MIISKPAQTPLRNPFATSYTAPGMLPWIEGSITIQSLAERFWQLGHRAAIVGPHGVGKSSLLVVLVPALGYEASTIQCWRLKGKNVGKHPAKENPTKRLLASLRQRPQQIKLLVVDGFEQLNWWQRQIVVWRTARNSLGLLVTSHTATQIPTLVELKPDPDILDRVVKRLLEAADTESRSPQQAALYERFAKVHCRPMELDKALDQHAGSIREVLMQWYDLFETFSKQHSTS